MPRGIPRCEQETIIRRVADEDTWTVYTCAPVWKRRLSRLAISLGISPTIVDRDGLELTLPANCVRFQAPYVLSAQERERRREHGRRLAPGRAARAGGQAEASIAET